MNKDILKRDFMAKRSQMRKKFFSTPHFNSRWFELTTTDLKYYSGNIENGPKSLKGLIHLDDIVVVETADGSQLGSRPYAFQVVHKTRDLDGEDLCILYVVCTQQTQQQEWIEAIRQACFACGCSFNKFFHSGVWLGKYYSCCNSIHKKSDGCEDATPLMSFKTSESNVIENGGFSSKKDDLIPFKKKDEQEQFKKPKPIENSLTQNHGSTENFGDYLDLQEHNDYSNNSRKWFYANICKKKAEEMLLEDGREGCFIIRDSSKPGVYALALLSKKNKNKKNHSIVPVSHYHIQTDNLGKLYFSNKHKFSSLEDLIFYHQHNGAGLVSRLKCYPRDFVDLPLISSASIDEKDLQPKEFIGSGQFGNVSRYIYKNCEVAVKEMKEEFMTEQEFIDEAKAMFSLSHPNLVKFLGICLTKPIKIVTEFVKYGALIKFLRRHKGALESNTSRLEDICFQISSGMKYLEENKIIHRDLATRNCLVGEAQTIKICDFGLARVVLENEYVSCATCHFSLRWCSPEALLEKRFSNKSDVWSFGVVMWEVFSFGRTPYVEIKEQRDVKKAICSNQKLPRPSICTNDVYQIMLRCWSYEPEGRPTFNDLFEILKNKVASPNNSDDEMIEEQIDND